ncbi:MAG: hypothetical protein MUF63_00265 [Rhodobacteraceae bacterium]|nr:hypothetical protein [Paracoccaceae bacterium]
MRRRSSPALAVATLEHGAFDLSTSRGKASIGLEEPHLLSEPGPFFVDADRSVCHLPVQSMPLVRPSFRELLVALAFAIETSCPARGEHAGAV